MTTSIDKLTPQAFFLHVDMYAVSPKFKTNLFTSLFTTVQTVTSAPSNFSTEVTLR